MSELILHHYAASPFAEKVRGILGYKRLAWRSVTISPVLPRPLLEPLVGPYRRTPVLQNGADVYCDTRCIARFLERAFPTPTLLPPGSGGLSAALDWVEPRMFVAMAALRFRRPETLEGFVGNGVSGGEFARDRAPFMQGALDVARLPRLEPAAFDQVRALLRMLEAALRESGGPFLTGPAASLADFSAGHLVWWLERAPRIADVLDTAPRIVEWSARLRAFGHGDVKPLTADEALRSARAADPKPTAAHGAPEAYGRTVGRRVRVCADDYGRDPVEGELVAQDADEIVIRREHPEVGTVWLHFPRVGFEILPVADAGSGSS